MTCPQIERARNSHPRIAIHKQSCRDSGHEDVPLTSRLPEPERPVNEPPDAWSLDDGLLGHCDSLCRCRGIMTLMFTESRNSKGETPEPLGSGRRSNRAAGDGLQGQRSTTAQSRR